MDRFNRISEIWNWLPVFRAVAETQHLPTASEWLHVSPAAISRTIKLLETSLGMELFTREGKQIRLNPSGELLLQSIRDAMRRVDDGIQNIFESEFTGAIHLNVAGPFNFTFGPVLERIAESHPELLPHLHAILPTSVNTQLLRGKLDVAFTPAPVPENGLEIIKVGHLRSSVYCGEGHPLYRARKVNLKRILEHPFAAPIPAESGPVADGWPREINRTIGLFVQHLYLALDLCAKGKYLAVFPDLVVSSYPQAKKLKQLPLENLPAIPFYAIRRNRLTKKDVVEVLIQIVKETLM